MADSSQDHQNFPANAPAGSVFRFTKQGLELEDYVDFDGTPLTSAAIGDIAFRESNCWRKIGVGEHFQELVKAIALAEGFPSELISRVISASDLATSVADDDIVNFLDASEDPPELKRITMAAFKESFLPPNRSVFSAGNGLKTVTLNNVPAGHAIKVHYYAGVRFQHHQGGTLRFKRGATVVDSDSRSSSGWESISGTNYVTGQTGNVTFSFDTQTDGGVIDEVSSICAFVAPRAFAP